MPNWLGGHVSEVNLYRNVGPDPFNQYFRKFLSKTQWIGLVQPEKA